MFKFICSIIFFFSIVSLAEQGRDSGRALVVYLENDSRRMGGPGSDQAYSNGFKFSHIYAQDKVPTGFKLPVVGFHILNPQLEISKLNFGLSLGHQIYTPNNINDEQPILGDRPYGAWLYLGFALSLRQDRLEKIFQVAVGIVGPSALGQEVQNNFHDVINRPEAKGWSNGLHDEPTLQFSYQERFKIFATKSWDFIPHYGAALGNVQIEASVGGLVRAGYHLPDDFGPGRPSAGDAESFIPAIVAPGARKTSAYLFAGTRGKAIARNIFLDGNTFRDSPRVKKYPFIFETEFGFGLQMLPVSMIWSFVTRSPEFEERSVFTSFASLNFTYLL